MAELATRGIDVRLRALDRHTAGCQLAGTLSGGALHPTQRERSIYRARTQSSPLKRASSILTVTSLLGAFSCAHSRPDGCSLPGKGAWREYRSKHFQILADEETNPTKLVASLEELHAAVLSALVDPALETPSRIRAVVLPARGDLANLLGPNVGGIYFRAKYDHQPTILFSADSVNRLPQVLAHELAHLLSYYFFPRQTPWFAEGLAQFVESVAAADSQGRRWAGGQPMNGWAGRFVPLLETRQLFTAKRWPAGPFYITSWLLYRYLWNQRSAQFTDYQRHLGTGESPDDAWRSSFPEWDPAKGTTMGLDTKLEYYQRHAAEGLRWEVKIGPIDRSYSSAAAPRGQLHMVLLEFELRKTNPILRNSLRRRVAQEVLREDPNYPLALLELAQLDNKPALAEIRAATTTRNSDGLSWYLLGHSATDAAEREAALRRAVELWPENAMAYAELASVLVSTGRARDALASADRAVELAPWNATAVASLAEVAIVLGKCKEAMVLQTRAVEVAEAEREREGSQEVDGLRRKLANYQSGCGGAMTRNFLGPESSSTGTPPLATVRHASRTTESSDSSR